MSAFLVSAKTRTIIAKYLAYEANNEYLSEEFENILKSRGCLLKGEPELYSSREIFRVLTEVNVASIVNRYGDDPAQYAGEYNNFVERTPIDTSIKNKKTWGTNLWTVCCCFLYQSSYCEGEDEKFCHEFCKWTKDTAQSIVRAVAREVRDETGKDWGEF